MDHKQQLSKLDPKLKEAYDKVMGTDLPAAPAQTPASQQPFQTVAAPAVPATPVAAPTPQVATPQASQPPLRRTTSTVHVGYQLQPPKVATQKKGKISPILIIAGIVIFFVIYTVIWVKIFNIPIPFLSILGL